MLILELDDKQSAGIREILGIAGDKATVEHHMGADRMSGSVGLPYQEAIIRTPLDTFLFRHNKSGYCFIGRQPAGGHAEFIEITNTQIAVAGHPLQATLPPTGLAKLLTHIVGVPRAEVVPVEYIHPYRQAKRAGQIYVMAKTAMQEVFRQIDEQASHSLEEWDKLNAPDEPKEKPKALPLEHEPTLAILEKLGCEPDDRIAAESVTFQSTETGFEIEIGENRQGHITYNRNQFGYEIEVQGPMPHDAEGSPTDLYPYFKVSHNAGGTAHVEWSEEGGAVRELNLPPVAFDKDAAHWGKADALLNDGPLRPDAGERKVRHAVAFLLNEVRVLARARPQPR